MYSKVIKRIASSDLDGAAWVDDSCESTASVYPEDPFAIVYRLSDNIYAVLSEPLNGTVDVWSYIINGPERALLVDTGYGVGDYRAVAEKLTGGKPYDVVITHDHVDHIEGNPRFERVFCHKYLMPYLEMAMKPINFNGLLDENGHGIWLDFMREDVTPFKKYDIAPCEDGHIFYLGGGYKVELLFTPGHAAGCCSLLDRTSRVLFCSDMVKTGRIACPGHHDGLPFEEYNCLHAFCEGIQNIVDHLNDFDVLYSGHNKIPLEKSCAVALLETCKAVLKDPENFDSEGLTPRGDQKVLFKDVPGLGTLEYKPTGI